jgi:ABC-type nitrate/sulfonate/bicarbonate transport system permease component
MRRRRVLYVALEILVPLLAIAAWWWTSNNSTSPYFPPLGDIIQAFRESWLFRHVPTDAAPSLGRMGAGYGIAIVVGISLGMLLGLVPLIARALGPPLEFLRAVPPPVLIPVAILVFGIGNEMKVFVIVAGCVWPILLNTIDGVRGVEPTMLEMSRSYGLSRARLWSRVLLPAALPQVFSGLRAALSIALILMVVSEMVASTNGIGFFVLDAQRTFAIPEMWSGIILLGVLGYTLNGLLMLAERRILRWHRGFRSSQLAAIPETR